MLHVVKQGKRGGGENTKPMVIIESHFIISYLQYVSYKLATDIGKPEILKA